MLMEDGLAALFLLCAAMKDGPLDDRRCTLPETHIQTREIPCKLQDKGRILDAICRRTAHPHTLEEGVRIRHQQGYANRCARSLPERCAGDRRSGQQRICPGIV